MPSRAWASSRKTTSRVFSVDFEIEGCRVLGRDTSFLDEPGAFESALSSISSQRREKACAYVFDTDRKMSVAASLLLDRLLSERGLSEANMVYDEDSEGKPSFRGYPGLHFSLAHGHSAAIAALADVPVGVDIEHLPSFLYDVAEPYQWTKMESVGKLVGCGVGGYIDNGIFKQPDNVRTLHIEKGDYLVCLALATSQKEGCKV